MTKFAQRFGLHLVCISVLFAAPMSLAEDNGVNLRRTVIVDVVEKTKNAVVYVSTTKTEAVRVQPVQRSVLRAVFADGSAARRLAGQRVYRSQRRLCRHQPSRDRRRGQITVELSDGRKLPADLVSSDPEADLAILKVKADKPLPTIELGDSSDLMIGEPVIAVGNPFGYSHSVSSGIVSALHRNLTGANNEEMLHDVIQTDAAINPGNSGGPLLNAYGQVIGINSAIRSDAQNIGFAIPVNRLRDLVPELMNPAHVNKSDLPIKLTESRKIIEPATVVSTVKVDGTDETVRTIGEEKPRDIIDAYAMLLRYKIGEPIKIVTDAGTRTVKETATALPDVMVQAKKKLGLTVESLTPLEAGKLGIDQESGVLVTDVDHGTVGDTAGLEKNDVIVQIGRFKVDNLDDLALLMQYMPKKGKVFVGIVRPQQQQMGRTFFDFGA